MIFESKGYDISFFLENKITFFSTAMKPPKEWEKKFSPRQ